VTLNLGTQHTHLEISHILHAILATLASPTYHGIHTESQISTRTFPATRAETDETSGTPGNVTTSIDHPAETKEGEGPEMTMGGRGLGMRVSNLLTTMTETA
jgi:hypothetical protein